MPERISVGQFMANAVGGTLRKLGLAKSKETPPIQTAARNMALSAGPMHVQDIPGMMTHEFAADLTRLVEQQAFAWVPLSDGYARKKQMLGLDPRILIATGRYVKSFQPIQDASGQWVVGIPATPLHAGSRHTLRDLARWLEFGTRTMPARPHWRPAMALWKTKSYQVKLSLKHGVRTYLRRRGFR